MHPLSGALHLPYVPAGVTRDALVTHRHSFAPLAVELQYRRTLVPLSVSQWNDHNDTVFDGVGLAGFKSRVNVFFCSNLLFLFVSNYFIFFFLPRVGCVGLVSSD